MIWRAASGMGRPSRLSRNGLLAGSIAAASAARATTSSDGPGPGASSLSSLRANTGRASWSSSGAEVEHLGRESSNATTGGAPLQLADQAGLAHSGLASNDHQTTWTGGANAAQQPIELGELRVATDQQVPPRLAGSASPISRCARCVLGEALQRDLAQRLKPDRLAENEAHAIGQQDLAGRRDVGQPSGQIHRLARDGVADLAATGRDYLAHGDAAMDLKLPARRSRKHRASRRRSRQQPAPPAPRRRRGRPAPRRAP